MRLYRLHIYLRYPKTTNYYLWDSINVSSCNPEWRFYNCSWSDHGGNRLEISKVLSQIEDVVNGLVAESTLLLYVHNDCGSSHIKYLVDKLLKGGREEIHFLYERYSSLPNPSLGYNYPNIHSTVKAGDTVNGIRKKVDYAQTYFESLVKNEQVS